LASGPTSVFSGAAEEVLLWCNVCSQGGDKLFDPSTAANGRVPYITVYFKLTRAGGQNHPTLLAGPTL
jgi:hypothetical protein